ncbi:hypothetical protein PRUPE_7G002100 [Prunus persica]|uniref:Uncharacterized protein n=1 Tax=Prunus persica TaxID=3760 RepID=A0A251N481_PRUPE|nr:hypothetical protein PRUPE_7G002100 [Prunus persica]
MLPTTKEEGEEWRTLQLQEWRTLQLHHLFVWSDQRSAWIRKYQL